jgi:rubrerythrin
MFAQIADEELEHHQRLKKLHEKWERNEKWPETAPLRVKDTIVKNVLKDSVQKIDKMPERDDDLEAIKTAIDFKAKGASHYTKLRDDVSDPKERQFFDLLAKIEQEHYLSLKDTEEYLTDPASRYVKKEHHGLDGA